jgi:hypothetical protein
MKNPGMSGAPAPDIPGYRGLPNDISARSGDESVTVAASYMAEGCHIRAPYFV